MQLLSVKQDRKKEAYKMITKKMTAALLCLALVLGMLTAATFSSQATTESATITDVEEPEELIDSRTYGQYSLNQVDTSLLVTHTGRSSELDNSEYLSNFGDALTDPDVYKDKCITLSCDSGLYDSLGFNAEELSNQAAKLATDKGNQNTLQGYTFVNPQEMMLCQSNRGDAFSTYFMSKQNQQITKASELPNNFDDAPTNTDVLHFHDDNGTWNNASSNGIGIDVDKDGTDEWLYLTLSQKENNNDDMHSGSYVRLRLYDRVASGSNYVWSQLCEQDYFMDNSNYVYDQAPYDQSRGYLPLAVGDYNGDGTEDLAFYMPDKSSSDQCNDASICIVTFTKSGDTASCQTLKKLYLKDITPDYGKMGTSWHLPTVALSTTRTRLGEVTKETGAKQYQTYDDLVISVSVPRAYNDKNLYLNSITAIYGLDKAKSSIERLFLNEYKPFDESAMDKRMNYVNTVDADLNGDGFKEIVVAGYKEVNLKQPSNTTDTNRRYGDLVKGTNYVNMITWAKNEKGVAEYQMLWKYPVEVKGQTNLSFRNSVEPIPLCAGHYVHDEIALKDQLCIQGVVLSCEGSKISGTPVYSEDLGYNTYYYYITDTQPYCDARNFPEGVSFDTVYLYDLNGHVSSDGDKIINNCVSGRFFTGSDVEQIVIFSSDPADGAGEFLYIDITILSDTPDRGRYDPFSMKIYNDYFDKQHGNEDGTTLFASFIDAEDDTFYYRWAGTYATVSAPSLYAIVQVPPFYREANSMYEYNCTISSGIGKEAGLDAGIGISGGEDSSIAFEIPGIEQSGEVKLAGGIELALEFAYNHTWANEKESSRSIVFKPNEDCAVCYVYPLVVNVYEVLKTLDDKEPQMFELSEKQDPIFTALSIDQYNNALQNSLEFYNHNKAEYDAYSANGATNDPEAVEAYANQLAPDVSAKIINPDNLPPSCAGDPVMYCHTSEGVVGIANIENDKDTQIGVAGVSVYNNSNEEMAGADVSFVNEKSDSMDVSLNTEISFSLGAKAKVPLIVLPDMELESTISVGFSAKAGVAAGRTQSSGVSFSATYYMPETELMDGVKFAADDHSYTDGKRIFHYAPSENSQAYGYNAYSVCYKLKDYSTEHASVDDDSFNTDLVSGDEVFVNSFYTTGLSDPAPPEPPEDFTVQSVKKKEDGSVDIRLIWDCRNRDPNRCADGYNIYLHDTSGNMETVHLKNPDGLILSPNLSRTENDDAPMYMYYTVHLESGAYPLNRPLRFYIAPAYRDKGTGDVTEGALCAKATIGSIGNIINGNLGIIEQPETYYMTRNAADETAAFSINVQKNVEGNGKVAFNWERYNKASGEWENILSDIPANQDAASFRSDCTISIPGGDKDSYIDTGIRCVASFGDFSVASDIVTIRYIDQKPASDSTPDEPEPAPDGVAISSYDDLAAFAKRVNDGENTLDAYLTNNIIVPEGAEWTVGVGTEYNHYNGTFDGRGYGVYGLPVSISDNGGLFGIIGNKGVIKELVVVGSSFQKVPTYAGGIAAFNYGTIDHCVSGVNLAEADPELRNSTVNGTISGGITAQNKGTVTGCRSAAVVEGVCCGGIAGMNDGKIYGCASNGPVGTDTAESAGGIAGENEGSIQSSYISGAVTCKAGDGVKGWIAGKNSSENVDYVLYPTSDVQAFGSSAVQTGENISGMADSDMKQQLFVKIMNEITDDTVTWVQAQHGDTYLNMGYPLIESSYLEQRTLSLQNGITVSGMLHSDLQIILEELDPGSDVYKAFASKGSLLSAYSVRIVDSHGNRVSSELWSAGGYQLHIPTNGKYIALLAHNTEGKMVMIAADKVENGSAVFTVADINSFAVIEVAAPSRDAASSTKDSADGDPADKTTVSNVTGASASVNGGPAVQTGEALPAAMLLLLLGALCVFIFMRRKTQELDK